MTQTQNAQSVALQLEKARDKLPLLYERDDLLPTMIQQRGDVERRSSRDMRLPLRIRLGGWPAWQIWTARGCKMDNCVALAKKTSATSTLGRKACSTLEFDRLPNRYPRTSTRTLTQSSRKTKG